MNNLTVESHIPIPKMSRAGRPPYYPFAKMKVGESFAVANFAKQKHNPVVSAACIFAKRNPKFKFKTRTVVEGAITKAAITRVWCVKSPNVKGFCALENLS